MGLLYTVLAVACGMFVGAAVANLITSQPSGLKGFMSWAGVILLAIISVIIGRYCQSQTGKLVPFLSLIPFILVEGFSIISGFLLTLRKRIKGEDSSTKLDWFTLVIFVCLVKLPVILWVIFLTFSVFNAFNALAFSAFLGTVCACVLWLGFNFAWLLLSFNKK